MTKRTICAMIATVNLFAQTSYADLKVKADLTLQLNRVSAVQGGAIWPIVEPIKGVPEFMLSATGGPDLSENRCYIIPERSEKVAQNFLDLKAGDTLKLVDSDITDGVTQYLYTFESPKLKNVKEIKLGIICHSNTLDKMSAHTRETFSSLLNGSKNMLVVFKNAYRRTYAEETGSEYEPEVLEATKSLYDAADSSLSNYFEPIGNVEVEGVQSNASPVVNSTAGAK